MTEVECVEYDHNKVVLLDAIGNAGLPLSYEYIVSHINSTNSQWIKRTGVHALRSFQDIKVISLYLVESLNFRLLNLSSNSKYIQTMYI